MKLNETKELTKLVQHGLLKRNVNNGAELTWSWTEKGRNIQTKMRTTLPTQAEMEEAPVGKISEIWKKE